MLIRDADGAWAKECSACNQVKPVLSEFRKSPNGPDGYAAKCLACCRGTKSAKSAKSARRVKPPPPPPRTREDVIRDWLALAEQRTGEDAVRLRRLASSLAACGEDGPIQTVQLRRGGIVTRQNQ